jgi:hypothetical protein
MMQDEDRHNAAAINVILTRIEALIDNQVLLGISATNMKNIATGKTGRIKGYLSRLRIAVNDLRANKDFAIMITIMQAADAIASETDSASVISLARRIKEAAESYRTTSVESHLTSVLRLMGAIQEHYEIGSF